MSKSITSRYKKRLMLLAALAVLVIGLMIKKKLAPSFTAWNADRELQAGSATVADLDRERTELEIRSRALEKRMGTGNDALDGWRTVLDLLTQQEKGANVSLSGVAEEHISSQEGLNVHTLPLSLEGRTDELIRLIDALERNGEGVFLLGVDMHAREIAYNKPRQLTATLYLQTLSR